MIVRIALGSEGEADRTGALATVAVNGGAVSLWIVAAGLIALAMWRLVETVLGLHPGESDRAQNRRSPIVNRLKAFGLRLQGCVAQIPR